MNQRGTVTLWDRSRAAAFFCRVAAIALGAAAPMHAGAPPTPSNCNVEAPLVDPPVSPTTLLHQTVTGAAALDGSRSLSISVGDSQPFSCTGAQCSESSFAVPVTLQPGDANRLTVCTHNRECGCGEPEACTDQDRNGVPLVIDMASCITSLTCDAERTYYCSGPSTATVNFFGGSGCFDVAAAEDCCWDTEHTAGVALASDDHGCGNGTVCFDGAGPASISVGDQDFHVQPMPTPTGTVPPCQSPFVSGDTDFGEVALGHRATLSLLIEPRGLYGGTFSFVTGLPFAAGTQVPVNGFGSVQLEVEFTPAAVGPVDGRLSISVSNDYWYCSSDGFVHLTGTGICAGAVGDCGEDGTVTIDELITMVTAALEGAPAAVCAAGDANGDGSITVDEIVMGVGYALNGCPVAPTFTPTRTPLPTPTPFGDVGGTIRYYHGKARVPGIAVAVTGSTTLTTQSDAAGRYVVKAVPLAGDWSVEASESDAQGSALWDADHVAVDANDADVALAAAKGARTLTPDQQLACDVDGDGLVTEIDAALIRQHAESPAARFPVADVCGSDWLFVPVPVAAANQCLVSPHVDAGVCTRGAIVLAPLVNGVAQQDFDGILFGDCDGNWMPPTPPGP